jgi:hypothetical protein
MALIALAFAAFVVIFATLDSHATRLRRLEERGK